MVVAVWRDDTQPISPCCSLGRPLIQYHTFDRGAPSSSRSQHMKPCSRTKTFLGPTGCRTRQPGRTWLLGPGAVVVLIKVPRFVHDGINKTKEWTRGRNPASKKLLVWSASLSRIQPSPWSFDRFHLSQNSWLTLQDRSQWSFNRSRVLTALRSLTMKFRPLSISRCQSWDLVISLLKPELPVKVTRGKEVLTHEVCPAFLCQGVYAERVSRIHRPRTRGILKMLPGASVNPVGFGFWSLHFQRIGLNGRNAICGISKTGHILQKEKKPPGTSSFTYNYVHETPCTSQGIDDRLGQNSWGRTCTVTVTPQSNNFAKKPYVTAKDPCTCLHVSTAREPLKVAPTICRATFPQQNPKFPRNTSSHPHWTALDPLGVTHTEQCYTSAEEA